MSPKRWRRRLAGVVIAGAVLGTVLLLGAGFWIPVKAELAQHLLERAWTQRRAGVSEARPWPWADTSPLARLSIPELDATWIVLSGASGRNLAFAPAHVDGSALPGSPGAMLIAGHRDTHFRALERIEHGMLIVLEQVDGTIREFRVANVEVVDATRSRIRIDAPASMLVLTTCYPFDSWRAGGPLRYVVTAHTVAAAAP